MHILTKEILTRSRQKKGKKGTDDRHMTLHCKQSFTSFFCCRYYLFDAHAHTQHATPMYYNTHYRLQLEIKWFRRRVLVSWVQFCLNDQPTIRFTASTLWKALWSGYYWAKAGSGSPLGPAIWVWSCSLPVSVRSSTEQEHRWMLRGCTVRCFHPCWPMGRGEEARRSAETRSSCWACPVWFPF